MATEKIISHWPHYLTTSDVASEAPATSEVASALYGRNRWIAETIKGGPSNDTGTVQIFANPQGTRGHDHSGPPYGPAFKHTILSWTGSLTSTATHLHIPYIDGIDTATGYHRITFSAVWQARAFDEHDGAPYAKAAVAFLANVDVGTAAVEVDMRTRVLGSTQWTNYASATRNLTTTLTKFDFAVAMSGIRSGKVHEAELIFRCTSRTSSARVYVRSVCVYNQYKLSS